jgi:NO-binding membrane sensor protein with MHYT domain
MHYVGMLACASRARSVYHVPTIIITTKPQGTGMGLAISHSPLHDCAWRGGQGL